MPDNETPAGGHAEGVVLHSGAVREAATVPPAGSPSAHTPAAERAQRILVTGSRDWTDRDTIYRALSETWGALGQRRNTILVQGECHLGGADQIAKDIWQRWGLPVESHPAEFGPDGHVLGPKRNAHMVSLGADVCLAFPLPSSRGTRNCMRLAREAGIPVLVYSPEGSDR